MSRHARILRCGLMALALCAATGGAARAQTATTTPATAQVAAPAAAPAATRRSCFSLSQWHGGWRSPSRDVIYISVDVGQIYRIDLSAGSNELQWPDRHLVTVVRGDDMICSPLDLDLSVSDGHFRTPLIAKAITRLTPEEVAALPEKDRP